MKSHFSSFFITAVAVGLASIIPASAAEMSTIEVHSNSMKIDITTAVLIPDAYAVNPHRHFPVIYFLDGFDGDGKRLFYDFCKDTLPTKSDELGIIMVAVGCKDKWYFDSPCHPEVRWQTFITKELIPYVDQHYHTIAKRSGRAITGLSMGGHGALYTAFHNPSMFVAAGSTSGGVDLRPAPFPQQWNIAEQLGPIADNPKRWDEHVVINSLDKLPKSGLGIYFDCGTSDFFLDVNRALRDKLVLMKVPATYQEFPGGHSTPYWQASFPRHVDFFATYFTAGKP